MYSSDLPREQINKALAKGVRWVKDMRSLPSCWERHDFQQRMVDKIVEGNAPLLERYAPIQVGVALCLHGCPLESKGQEKGARESRALYYAMQARLIERCPLTTPAWMNHPVPGKRTTPDVDQAAKSLVTLGAQAMVFAPIAFVAENHETQLDIGYTIDKDRTRSATFGIM